MNALKCRIPPTFNRRWLSSSPTLETNKYHRLADHLLDHLHDSIDTIIDQHPQADSFDTSLSMGVLTVKLSSLGTFVINKQPPNLQVWLSSPVSGPSRYDYDDTRKEWVYKRNNKELVGVLNEELTTLFKQPVRIVVPKL
jgi:frataxin